MVWFDKHFATNSFNRLVIITCFGIAIGFLILYGLTAIRLPVSYADSNDLLLAGKYFGLAHPPGFTWLTIGLYPVLNWLPPTMQVMGAHLTSGLISSINTALLFLVGVVLLNRVFPYMGKKVVWWGSLLGTVIFGLGMRQWAHATMLEVFPLAQFLLLVYVLVWMRLIAVTNKPRQLWFWGVVAGGVGALAVSFHPLSSLLVVVTGGFSFYWLYKNVVSSVWLKTVGLFLFAGLVVVGVYGGIYVLVERLSTVYGWPIELSLSGIKEFYLRQVYAEGGSAIESLASDIDVKKSIDSLIFHVPIWIRNLSVFGGLLVLWGLLVLARQKHWMVFLWLLSMMIVAGWAIVAYLKYPVLNQSSDTEYFWGVALRLRMQYMAAIAYGLAVIVGIAGLLNLSFFKIAKRRRTLIAGLIVSMMLMVVSRYRLLDASDGNLDHVYSQRILESLPEGSVLLVDSDYAFQFMAEKQLYSVGADVLVVPVRIPLLLPEEQSFKDRNGILQVGPVEEYVADWVVKSFANGKRVFLYSPDIQVLDYLGVEGNPFFAMPYGYVFEIGISLPEGPLVYDYGISKQLSEFETDVDEWWVRGMQGHLGEIHTLLAYYFARLGYSHQASVHADLADQLTVSALNKQAIDSALRVGNQRLLDENSYAEYELAPWQSYLGQGLSALDEGNLDSASYLITRSYLMTGGNGETLEGLMRYAIASGDEDAAMRWQRRLELLSSD